MQRKQGILPLMLYKTMMFRFYRSLAKVTTHTANGEIINNGVRLRKSPSTSATILELMYDGELIWIDWSAYGSAGLNWHRVQRIKTGTYGWVSKSYVYHWD